MLPFPREIGLKRQQCTDYQAFCDYINTLNGKTSLYTSLYSFTSTKYDKPWRYDYTTAIIDKAWWDFDTTEQYGIERVKEDVAQLIRRLVGDVRVVATGRGFHVYQYFKRSVTGHEWRHHLIRYQREMAKGLPTLDGVGLPEKLVRIPRTYNPKRGRWAVPITPHLFADDPLSYDIPNHPNDIQECPFLGIPNGRESFDLVLWVHDNPIQTKATESVSVAFSANTQTTDDITIPPCIGNHIVSDNPSHFTRLALVQFLSEELRWYADPDILSDEDWKAIESKIFDYIKGLSWRDFNEYRTRVGIRTNMKYKQSPTCRAFSSRNMCASRCWKYDGTF